MVVTIPAMDFLWDFSPFLVIEKFLTDSVDYWFLPQNSNYRIIVGSILWKISKDPNKLFRNSRLEQIGVSIPCIPRCPPLQTTSPDPPWSRKAGDWPGWPLGSTLRVWGRTPPNNLVPSTRSLLILVLICLNFGFCTLSFYICFQTTKRTERRWAPIRPKPSLLRNGACQGEAANLPRRRQRKSTISILLFLCLALLRDVFISLYNVILLRDVFILLNNVLG